MPTENYAKVCFPHHRSLHCAARKRRLPPRSRRTIGFQDTGTPSRRVGGQRPAKNEALNVIALVAAQELELLSSFNALGDNVQTKLPGHSDDCRANCSVVGIVVQVLDE